MFCTYEHDKIDLPIDLAGDDARSLWANVRLRLFTPYFHVLMRGKCHRADRDVFTVLLSSVHQLWGASHQIESEIVSAQIVTPSRLNGTDDWRMDLLKR